MDNKEALAEAGRKFGAYKEGKLTSEYATAKATGNFSIAVVVVGLIMSFADYFTAVADGGPAAKYVGGAVMVCGLIAKTLSSLGYMKTRADVKTAQANKDAAETIAGNDG